MFAGARVILCGALAVALAGDARAQEYQYRRIKLADGRELTARILATEPTAFQVELPQGQMYVPFALLYDMEPISEREYTLQNDWVVYVAAPEDRAAYFERAISAIPHVDAYVPDGGSWFSLSPQQAAAAAACGYDAACVMRATADAPWMWVVVARKDGEQFVLEAGVNHGDAVQTIRLKSLAPDDMRPAVFDALLDLVHDQKEVADVTTALVPGRGSIEVGPAAFVPIPGLALLKHGDYARFGAAVGVVLPATVGWYAIAGHTAQTRRGQLLTTAVGYYAFTVAANQVLGWRALNEGLTLGVAPSRDGAQFAVTVTGR